MNQMIAPPFNGTGAARAERAVFTGENGAFRRLVTMGALLEVLTFGFYRFWLTTNMRRHLWTHTSVAGDTLEYTGRGRELLLGFLFALAVLVPIYILFFVISIEATRLQAFLSFPLVLFFYLFGQFAIYRARRYRLTRTIWRGVRFWMTGSAWAYAGKALAWQLMNAVTLGLSYPWSVASLERYKIGHTNYGDLQGEFVGKGGAFFKRGWWLWLLAWTPVAAFIAIAPRAGALEAAATTKLEHAQAAQQTGGLVLLASLSLLILPFIFAAFKAIEWKWWLESIRFGDVRLECDLKRSAFIGNYLKLLGITMLVGIGGSIVVAIIAAIAFMTMKSFGISPEVFINQMKAGHMSAGLVFMGVAIMVPYLALIQAFGIVNRIYMIQRIWKIVMPTVSVLHLEAAEHVTAEGAPASAFGEGLADGLDLAGF